MVQREMAELLGRDVTKVREQVKAFGEERLLWKTPPGVTNSAGNLVLHLEGNLREYIGRLLGAKPYERQRPAEFSGKGVPASELIERMDQVATLVHQVAEQLTDAELAAAYPQPVLGYDQSVHGFLIHLHGHLNYHLGQIDYLRRILTGQGAIQYPSRFIPSNAAVL